MAQPSSVPALKFVESNTPVIDKVTGNAFGELFAAPPTKVIVPVYVPTQDLRYSQTRLTEKELFQRSLK